MFRRPSGVYVVRLAVPLRLRATVGKRELIHSTGLRDLDAAKAVATQVQAGWRSALRLAQQTAQKMDIARVNIGSPKLHLGGYLPLHEASEASGLTPAELLRAGAEGHLGVYVDVASTFGYTVPLADLDYDPLTGGYDIPPPELLPSSALPGDPGPVRVAQHDLPLIVEDLLAGRDQKLMALHAARRPDALYCPSGGINVRLALLQFLAGDVERLRGATAAHITPAQLRAAEAAAAAAVTAAAAATVSVPRASAAHASKHVLDLLDDYMADRARLCAPDQARRIRAACELFAELMDNPQICEVDRILLRRYRDEVLPTVPADENKVRLLHGTTRVRESIDKIAGTDWPRISGGEVRKRMQWLCGFLKWLHEEKMLTDDPGVGLARSLRVKRDAAASGDRDLFTRDELKQVFSASWFAIGRGELTRAGTYREFLPYYYWLPLLGLYTGGRINELCQLHLDDIRQTPSGTWYIDINTDAPEEGVAALKRTKNVQSVRRVPMHPHLITLGLPNWRDRLAAEGHQRLFPELRYNERKGFSAPAVKWFSAYLKRLGWPRDGKKVFHSFRHTVATECVNALKLPDHVVCQLTGHNRAAGQLARYRKDEAVVELATSVARLDFGLPTVASFDVEAGMAALQDALRRKQPARRRASPEKVASTEQELGL